MYEANELLLGLTAVDRHGVAGDEGGLGRAEPDDRARDLLGIGWPSHRHAGGDFLALLGGHQGYRRGLDDRRTDRVDPEALVGVFERDRPREADHAVFTRAVGRPSGTAPDPGVLVAVLGASVLEEPALEEGESGLTYFFDAARAVPARTVLSLYVAIFGIFVVLYGAQLTAVPFVLDQQYHLSPGVIGVLLALPAVTMGITSSQAGRLLRHLSSVQLVPLGFVAYGIGLIGVGMANSVPVIAASLLLFGLGQGLSEPITDTALNVITPDEFRGGVMSVRTSVLQAGTTVGPPLFIALATTVGYLDVLVDVGVAAFGLGTVAFVLIARYRRRTENQY